MNTESILTRVNDILRMEGEASRHAALRVLSDDLAAQLRREIAAENKQGSALKVITGLLRTVRKTNARTTLHYAWKDEKGRQCVCDGYRAYRLAEPLPLEDRPADAGEPINLSAIVPDVAKGGYRAVPLPAARDVRALIALERAAKGRKAAPLWEFGPGLPAVNAAYLLELMTVLPGAAAIYCGTDFAPLYLQAMKFSEDGERIVVRLSEQDGRRGNLRLPRKVQVLNMLEDVERETDSVDYTPFEILTLGWPVE